MVSLSIGYRRFESSLMHLSRIPGRLAPELSTPEGDKKIQKIGRPGYSNDQIGPNGGGSGAGRIVALPRFAAPAALRSVVVDEESRNSSISRRRSRMSAALWHDRWSGTWVVPALVILSVAGAHPAVVESSPPLGRSSRRSAPGRLPPSSRSTALDFQRYIFSRSTHRKIPSADLIYVVVRGSLFD